MPGGVKMSKDKKYGNIEPDDFLRYLSDGLSDEERHALEREMQKDPFVEEALEGLSSLSTEEARQDLSRLHSRLRKRVEGSRRRIWIRVAASVAILAAIGTIYFTVFYEGSMLFDRRIAGTETETAAEEKGLPEDKEIVTEKAEQMPDDQEGEYLQPEKEGPDAEMESRNADAETQAGEMAAPAPVPVEDQSMDAAESSPDADMEEELVLARDAAGTQQGLTAVDSARFYAVEPEAVSGQEIVEAETESGLKETGEESATEYPANQSQAKRSNIAQPTAMEEPTGREYAGMDEAESDRKKLAAMGSGQEDVRALILNDTVPAMPEGGLESFNEYIARNVRFPGTEGVLTQTFVILSFSVGSGGPAREIEIEESPGEAFSREAIRLLQEGPQWYPALRNRIPVVDKTRLRIEFIRQ